MLYDLAFVIHASHNPMPLSLSLVSTVVLIPLSLLLCSGTFPCPYSLFIFSYLLSPGKLLCSFQSSCTVHTLLSYSLIILLHASLTLFSVYALCLQLFLSLCMHWLLHLPLFSMHAHCELVSSECFLYIYDLAWESLLNDSSRLPHSSSPQGDLSICLLLITKNLFFSDHAHGTYPMSIVYWKTY